MPPSSKENKDAGPAVGKQAAGAPAGVSSRDFRFVIAAARTNAAIVERLIEGALAALGETGTAPEDVPVFRTPGAFELPLAAQRLAGSGRYHAVIALGCVIRGETAHFEHVSRVAADGLSRAALDTGVPVAFGVLTTETSEQAWARAGGASGNLGADAARAALEMAALLRSL